MLKDECTVFAVNYNGYDWLAETHSAGKRKITRISSPLFFTGQYCIYKRDRCPSGLKEGFVRWDDDDVDGSSLNKNDKGGTLPEGIYDQNTKINFCCRTDGRKSHPVLLPTRDPFLLLAYGSEKCQMVKGTVATQEWIHYRTETSSNADKSNGAIPYRGGQRHPTIHYCYYQGESESHRVTETELFKHDRF